MNLIEIDKVRYQKHLNRVFIGMAASMILMSLTISTLLIYLLGSQTDSNFWLNLFGAVIAAILIVLILMKFRHHSYLKEVSYVWDLKQQLNLIQRKQRSLDAAAKEGDNTALIILNFQYRGSKQLYELDDNFITLDDLNLKIAGNDVLLKEAGLSLSTALYDPSMLKNY